MRMVTTAIAVRLALRGRLILCGALALAACTPYKIDIRQGNFVDEKMVAKLKPGMTRSQVRFVLGTPLLADPFHPERWDYVYSYRTRGRLVDQRKLTVVFEGDKLARLEGVALPAPSAQAVGKESASASNR